jgi:hypothetical protein
MLWADKCNGLNAWLGCGETGVVSIEEDSEEDDDKEVGELDD